MSNFLKQFAWSQVHDKVKVVLLTGFGLFLLYLVDALSGVDLGPLGSYGPFAAVFLTGIFAWLRKEITAYFLRSYLQAPLNPPTEGPPPVA